MCFCVAAAAAAAAADNVIRSGEFRDGIFYLMMNLGRNVSKCVK